MGHQARRLGLVFCEHRVELHEDVVYRTVLGMAGDAGAAADPSREARAADVEAGPAPEIPGAPSCRARVGSPYARPVALPTKIHSRYDAGSRTSSSWVYAGRNRPPEWLEASSVSCGVDKVSSHAAPAAVRWRRESDSNPGAPSVSAYPARAPTSSAATAPAFSGA